MNRAKPKTAPHVFQPDPDVPADRGRQVCRCGLVGAPGDTHHRMPIVPEQAAVLSRYDHEER